MYAQHPPSEEKIHNAPLYLTNAHKGALSPTLGITAVEHPILLYKMERYGIRGTLLHV